MNKARLKLIRDEFTTDQAATLEKFYTHYFVDSGYKSNAKFLRECRQVLNYVEVKS